MSKRKIPYRSSVRGDSPSGTGTGTVTNRDGSARESVPSGSPLPYQGQGFEGRWDSVQDLFDLLRQRGASTKGDKAIQSALSSMSNANNLSNSFFELLGNLGINIADQSKERTDQLFQFMLQAGLINDQRTFDEYLKNDQRQFDWAMKQEQRLYDNPQNELARLMGAGISRDAALQLMSGSAGGSGLGAGSSVPYGSGTGISAPSQLATSGTQDLAIANTVMNGVQAFMQLVQSGVGVAEGIEQVQAMQAQNYWNSEQMQSYDAVKQVGMQIEQLKASGVLDDDTISSWSNLQDMQSWLDDHASTNGVAPLVQSGALKRAFGTPFGRQRMTDYYSNVIRGRSEGTQAQQFIEQQRLNNVILGLQPEKIGAEIEQIGQNMKESEQRVIESCNRVAVGEAQIELMDKQGNFIEIQGVQLVRKTDAEVDLMGSQSYLADVQGQQAAQIFEYNSAGFPMLKQAYIQECTDKLSYWNTINNPDVRRDRIFTWLNDNENAAKAAWLKHIQLDAVGSFAHDYPQLWELSQGFQYAGVNEMIRTGAEVGGAGAALGNTGAAIYKASKYVPKVP